MTANARPPAAARAPAHRILAHCPELTLKGGNRVEMQRRLCANIAHRLSREGLDWTVKRAYGRIYVDTDGRSPEDVQRAVACLRAMPGVSSVAAASWLRPSSTRQHSGELDWPLIEATVADLARALFAEGQAFAVRVNRADNRLRTKAPEMEARLGDVIRRTTPWQRINLDAPDRTFHIDVYPDGMFVYADKLRGIGGLPVGAGGTVLSLLSGGIDSPVAAYMLAKRGCRIELLHMSAAFTDADRIDASTVGDLARHISRYALETRLWVAPYVHFDLALPERESGYSLLLFRRFLLRTAEVLARRIGARALAAGDSVGQVASQTLENMASTSDAASMTVLRPLVGLNKEEIIEIARAIGTFETSIRPYKDCCALLAKKARTRSTESAAAALEQRLLPGYDALIEQTLADTLCLNYDSGRRVT